MKSNFKDFTVGLHDIVKNWHNFFSYPGIWKKYRNILTDDFRYFKYRNAAIMLMINLRLFYLFCLCYKYAFVCIW